MRSFIAISKYSHSSSSAIRIVWMRHPSLPRYRSQVFVILIALSRCHYWDLPTTDDDDRDLLELPSEFTWNELFLWDSFIDHGIPHELPWSLSILLTRNRLPSALIPAGCFNNNININHPVPWAAMVCGLSGRELNGCGSRISFAHSGAFPFSHYCADRLIDDMLQMEKPLGQSANDRRHKLQDTNTTIVPGPRRPVSPIKINISFDATRRCFY